MHISLKEILKDAKEKKYGIPCLAGSNLEILTGVINAAENKQSPIIVCYNKQLSPGISVELLIPLIVKAAKLAKIPVCTILDHGSEFDLVMKAIHYGFSSVMYDGSGLPFEENASNTEEIVKIAHSLGVSVEAELGGVGGSVLEATATSSKKSFPTDPSQALEFVRRTGIDALAISFGNAHGKYFGEPKINLELVKQIAAIIDIPLVMHGASGLSLGIYREIIGSGISKINYFSSICKGSYTNAKCLIDNSEEDAFCIHAIPASIKYWENETGKLLDLLMCSGKANNFKNSNYEANSEFSVSDENKRMIDAISDSIYTHLKKSIG